MALKILRAYKIESSISSSCTNGMALFILSKTINKTLKISPILSAPKSAPNSLFKIPKEAKSANFVNAFPAKANY